MTKSVATRDFFISRAGEDKIIAIAIDNILRGAEYTTFIQDHDFGSTAFTERMDEGFAMVEAGARIVALLSGDYLNKPHCMTEARYPLIDDSSNTRQRLIVLRIGECSPPGSIKPIPYTDLVPVLHDLVRLKAAVLHAVDPALHPRPASASAAARTQQQIRHSNIKAVKSFAAREPEMKALEAVLWKKSGRAALTNRANNPQANVAMKGLGGVGKSVLARQYAWDNAERYQGVWWLRAELKQTLLDDLVDLGARILDPSLKNHPNPAEAAAAVLDHVTQHPWEKPWLLVYDNAESPEAIRQLTPSAGAHVLITTRCQDWYGEAEELPVDVFPRDVAVDYLMGLARGSAQQPEATRAAAGRLSDDLGCLPLALAIARAQAWGNNWSFDVYRRQLADMLTRLPTGAVDYPMPLFAAFTLSLDKAAATAPQAERLMALAAFLAPDEIPLDLFSDDVMPAIEKGEAVAALAAQSLVTLDSFPDGTPSISVHRLVQQVMRARLADGHRSDTATAAVGLVSGAFKMPVYASELPVTMRLVPHAIAVLEQPDSRDDWHRWTLTDELAGWLMSRGDRPTAFKWFTLALASAQRRLADDPVNPQLKRDVSISLNKIADVLKEEGNRPGALINYQKSLAIAEQLAADDPVNPQLKRDVSISYERLGDFYAEEGKTADAAVAIRKALSIYDDLVRQFPDDLTSLVFSVVPHRRLAGLDPANARHHLKAALSILKPLATAGRLDAMRQGWIPGIEAQLAALGDNTGDKAATAAPATAVAPVGSTAPKAKRNMWAWLFGK